VDGFLVRAAYAREVVEAEGFTDFGNRRRRLELLMTCASTALAGLDGTSPRMGCSMCCGLAGR
jgi:hypothetical protein